MSQTTCKPTDIEAVAEPVVGRFYWVPCVELPKATPYWAKVTRRRPRLRVVPVLGPGHEDNEIIGFKLDHWHLDWRFINDRALARWPRRDNDFMATVQTTSVDGNELTLVRHRLRCRRPMPTFPQHEAEWGPKLEQAYARHTLGKCRTCPHRGIPLNGIRAQNGILVCPGHGLAWNLATGRQHRRFTVNR